MKPDPVPAARPHHADHAPPIELDLTDAVAVYLDRCEAEGFAASTVALYRIVLEQFVAFAGRQDCTRTRELTLELALAWQRYLRTERVNDRGRRRGAHSRRLAPLYVARPSDRPRVSTGPGQTECP